jgi:hypothetical protein
LDGRLPDCARRIDHIPDERADLSRPPQDVAPRDAEPVSTCPAVPTGQPPVASSPPTVSTTVATAPPASPSVPRAADSSATQAAAAPDDYNW